MQWMSRLHARMHEWVTEVEAVNQELAARFAGQLAIERADWDRAL